MKVNAYKTPKIHVGDNFYQILDAYLPEKLRERSVVAIASKIISITQEDVIKNTPDVNKKELIKQEADFYYLGNTELYEKFRTITTITNNVLIQSAGIDESNGDGYYILWPENLQKKTNEIWEHLKKKYRIKNLGIIITDGHVIPLRWGVRGIGVAWCGIKPLKHYIGTEDLFGREIHNVNGGILDGLAASAALVMGEGKEQTPLAVISDIPFVEFVSRVPLKSELHAFTIDMKFDLYAPLLTSVRWQKGKRKKKKT